MPDDPWLSHYGHPILPAGYNADDNNGDEVDGAGTNWPIWPYLFDAFIPLEVLIITPEMMDVFDGCPDWVAPSAPNSFVAPAEPMSLTLPASVRGHVVAAPDVTYSPSAPDNVIVFPAEPDTLVVTEEAA